MSDEQILHMMLPNAKFAEDLDRLLLWLSPAEHQCKPPSLRIKKSIQRIRECFQLSSDFTNCLVKLYIDLIRFEFISYMKENANCLKFNDVLKLENRIEHPRLFIPELEFEYFKNLHMLRHYLLDSDKSFKTALCTSIENLIMEDDFYSATIILDWIDSAYSIDLSPKDLVLDMLVKKIAGICSGSIRGSWTRRFIVIETFNDFIEVYWSHFAQLLKCPENDHELTKTVFKCFEREFINIRINEIFEIFTSAYPESKPTILELRKVMKAPKDLQRLTYTFLDTFKDEMLNPCVTTIDALTSYLKAIKGFLLLDPAGRYLNLVTTFVKPYFQDKSDLINILLYAILDLKPKDFEDLNISYIPGLNKLSLDMREDPEFSIENVEPNDNNYKRTVPNLESIGANSLHDKGTLIQDHIMKQFMMWVPEPNMNNLENDHDNGNDFEEDNNDVTAVNSIFYNVNLLDILLDLFESKEIFIGKFVNLLTIKFFKLQNYRVDPNWQKCLELINSKFNSSNISMDEKMEEDVAIGTVNPTNENYVDEKRKTNASNDMEEIQISLNKIEVMLNDIRHSEKFSFQISSELNRYGLRSNNVGIKPKFISPLYWDYEDNELGVNNFLKENVFDEECTKAILQYASEYCSINKGFALHYCKGKEMIEVEISFNDGAIKGFLVNASQYYVLTLFDTGNEKLTIESILTAGEAKRSKNEIIDALKFWVEKNVLVYEGGYYYSRDLHSIENSKGNTTTRTDDLLVKEALPYIKTMLESFGNLSASRIQNFLKATLPAAQDSDHIITDIHSVLDTLVSDGILFKNSSGSYKLADET
ncbi:hypothetical protein KAFR_0H02280 [Kazachstania africana CBS 2517]|uniref:Anaphase-promoting complex subunit 2 n=1 Tax=Kazachstania africana (strain ATCC 22294 / BCRC 22015 / CBS 2517 / CECT 1963 / NBRC 1671 / NRRL Y-8276) TaxID=1071382 RepID=H2AZ81_KAZAF|nr:hypothetical protein KAFR_0H02280 [Kazachstania africana CBS 2517]CCF59637.1 hypothetical protein KAFR_0H02280 [Kazachstania africana CBS 2517]